MGKRKAASAVTKTPANTHLKKNHAEGVGDSLGGDGAGLTHAKHRPGGRGLQSRREAERLCGERRDFTDGRRGILVADAHASSESSAPWQARPARRRRRSARSDRDMSSTTSSRGATSAPAAESARPPRSALRTPMIRFWSLGQGHDPARSHVQ
jgi:hypothetical protein